MNQTVTVSITEDQRDCYQEISNVAMGQAADLLARLLDVKVILPIPVVNLIEVNELRMALSGIENTESVSGVCQGFIGNGISGEALLIFNDTSFADISSLLKYGGITDSSLELELLMDVANILIGACLRGVGEQLDVGFSQGHPVVLGQHVNLTDLIKAKNYRWTKTLAIEINYKIEGYDINCDLLLLFTEDAIGVLNEKVNYLLED
ncbi:histidine kinase [Catenovulum sediminis]|uniref:Histidine kinase n=1 Tax=Catenovulum sediminis TaxID=1740262 RepID=A0ABV1RJP8_9ALTE